MLSLKRRCLFVYRPASDFEAEMFSFESVLFAAAEIVAWLETRHTSDRPQRLKRGFFPLVFAQWCGNYGSQVGASLYQISFLAKDRIWRCYFSIRAE